MKQREKFKADIDGVGTVLFRFNRRARRIILRISYEKGVSVTIPVRAGIDEAVSFLISKKEWISKQKERLRILTEKQKASLPVLPPIDKTAASKMLIERTKELAAKYDFRINKISVREQRRIWGSCSANGNISLNIKLSYLPAHLIDHIIIHELMHTRIRRHDKHFYDALEMINTGAKAFDREVKKWPLGLL